MAFNLFDFSSLGGNQINKAVSNQKLPTVAPYNPGVQPTYSKPVQKTTVGGEVKLNGPSTPGIYDKLYNMGTGLADWTAGVVTERAKEERQGGMTENQMRAVVKEMRKDKLSDEDIALQLEAIDNQLKSEYKQQEQKNYEQASPIRKLAGGAVNIAAGNLQTLSQYGGNILDVATLGQTGIGEDVSKMMEQNKDIYGNSTAFKAGTFLPDVALGVSPIGGGYLAGAKGAGSLALRSGAVGAGFGATQPILEQGSNVDIGDIVTGGAIGGTLGAALPLAGAGIVKGAKGIKNIATGADRTMQNIARMDPGKQIKFKKMTGMSEGEYLVGKGIVGDTETVIQRTSDEFIKSKNAVDKAMDMIPGKFKNADFSDMADDVAKFAKSVDDRKNIARLEKLANKSKTEGLTLSEVNEIKRYFERNNKFSYGKDMVQPEKYIKATNLDSRVRNAQLNIAEKAGFGNIREMNKQTQALRMIADEVASKLERTQGNELISLTDFIAGSTAGLPGYVAGKSLKSSMFKSGLAKAQAKISGKLGKNPIIKPNFAEIKKGGVEYKQKLVNRAGKRFAEDLNKTPDALMLPEPSGKPTSAKVINVKPIELPSKLQQNEITGKSIIKRPKGEVKTQGQATLGKEIIRNKQLSKITEELKRSTQSARYGGTGETKIVDSIKAMLNNKEITKEEAQNILFDVLDRIDEKGFDYMEGGKTISKFIDDLATYKSVDNKVITPKTIKKPSISIKKNENKSEIKKPSTSTTSREIPEGYIENPLTGEIIKKPKGMNAGFLKIGVPENPLVEEARKIGVDLNKYFENVSEKSAIKMADYASDIVSKKMVKGERPMNIPELGMLSNKINKNEAGGNITTIGDIIQDKELRTLYKDALNTPVTILDERLAKKGQLGGYVPKGEGRYGGHIVLFGGNKEISNNLPNTILHEAAHAIRDGKGRKLEIDYR